MRNSTNLWIRISRANSARIPNRVIELIEATVLAKSLFFSQIPHGVALTTTFGADGKQWWESVKGLTVEYSEYLAAPSELAKRDAVISRKTSSRNLATRKHDNETRRSVAEPGPRKSAVGDYCVSSL